MKNFGITLVSSLVIATSVAADVSTPSFVSGPTFSTSYGQTPGSVQIQGIANCNQGSNDDRAEWGINGGVGQVNKQGVYSSKSDDDIFEPLTGSNDGYDTVSLGFSVKKKFGKSKIVNVDCSVLINRAQELVEAQVKQAYLSQQQQQQQMAIEARRAELELRKLELEIEELQTRIDKTKNEKPKGIVIPGQAIQPSN